MSGTGKTLDHINFDSKDSCTSAKQQFLSEKLWGEYWMAICVEDKHD